MYKLLALILSFLIINRLQASSIGIEENNQPQLPSICINKAQINKDIIVNPDGSLDLSDDLKKKLAQKDRVFNKAFGLSKKQSNINRKSKNF